MGFKSECLSPILFYTDNYTCVERPGPREQGSSCHQTKEHSLEYLDNYKSDAKYCSMAAKSRKEYKLTLHRLARYRDSPIPYLTKLLNTT